MRMGSSFLRQHEALIKKRGGLVSFSLSVARIQLDKTATDAAKTTTTTGRYPAKDKPKVGLYFSVLSQVFFSLRMVKQRDHSEISHSPRDNFLKKVISQILNPDQLEHDKKFQSLQTTKLNSYISRIVELNIAYYQQAILKHCSLFNLFDKTKKLTSSFGNLRRVIKLITHKSSGCHHDMI